MALKDEMETQNMATTKHNPCPHCGKQLPKAPGAACTHCGRVPEKAGNGDGTTTTRIEPETLEALDELAKAQDPPLSHRQMLHKLVDGACKRRGVTRPKDR